MNFEKPIDIAVLSQSYDLEILATDSDSSIIGINEIHKVASGDITFVDVAKYYDKAFNSDATFIIINAKDVKCPKGKSLLYSKNPFLTYNQIAKDYFPTQHSNHLIHPSAVIGKSSIIYPNVFIGPGVTIGENCIIYPNTTIYANTTIGNDVIIHSNTAINSDAFYYNKQGGEYNKMHTIGTTVIEDKVEIGSNCSIDSGVSGVTRIGRGTKLDNSIHIAHGVVIGENCLLCAQVAVAGKTTIGNNVILYGKVGVSKGITIGDNAIILASSNVDKSLEGGQRYFGSPAVEARLAMKHFAAARMLPEFMNKLKHLINQDATIDK
jgi:UDP-3-O-[3-hydroxymyristoyl] glucosamine N-acyltransferase